MSFLDGLVKSIPLIGDIARGADDANAAKAINPIYTPYAESQYAQQQLGYANANLNGEMAGASSASRNIQANQSNAIAGALRSATSPAQAQALIAATQGQADASANNLATMEGQNHNANVANVNNALGVMTNEGDKVYQDKLNHYQQQQSRQDQFNKASDANFAAFGNDALKVGAMAFGVPPVGGITQDTVGRTGMQSNPIPLGATDPNTGQLGAPQTFQGNRYPWMGQ